MRSRRLEIFAFTAMLFAMLALFVALQSNSRAEGGPGGAPAASTAPEAVAAVPNTFNYQGFLRNPDGTPMNGNYGIGLTFYDQASGGNNWAGGSWPNVPVRDGLFNVVMENTGDLFTAHSPLYVGVSVNGEPELIPRQRIHPVPWASLANTATTATTLTPGATVSNLNLTGVSTFDDLKVSKPFGAAGLTAFESTGQGTGVIFGTPGGWRLQVNSTDTIMYQNAYVGGKLTVIDSPVLIKRWSNYQGCSSNEPCLIPTGINISTHWCTMAGWDMNYDVSESSTGLWSRWLYTDANGQWVLKISNHTQNNIIPVYAEIVCFRSGIYGTQAGTTSSTVDGADPSMTQAPVQEAIPAETGQ